MNAASPHPRRVRQTHIDWLSQRLNERDMKILEDVARVRLLTGHQLERLHFSTLTGRSRSVVRWRTLKRLVDWRVLTTLDRRIGGSQHGSATAVFALDTAGQALLPKRTSRRRPGAPGERFTAHILDGAELYVQLIERQRAGGLELVDYRAEPDAWMPDGLGGWLKPDAYAVVAAGTVEDVWAIEIDRATEHLPTIRRKCETYLDFQRRGQLGPHGVMPRVLISVPDEQRRGAVASLLNTLPGPGLFRVATLDMAAETMANMLRE